MLSHDQSAERGAGHERGHRGEQGARRASRPWPATPRAGWCAGEVGDGLVLEPEEADDVDDAGDAGQRAAPTHTQRGNCTPIAAYSTSEA